MIKCQGIKMENWIKDLYKIYISNNMLNVNELTLQKGWLDQKFLYITGRLPNELNIQQCLEKIGKYGTLD